MISLRECVKGILELHCQNARKQAAYDYEEIPFVI